MPGEGASKVELPTTDKGEVIPDTLSSCLASPAPRVLFVDDDSDVRELFADAISRRGFAVDAAESGPDAIRLGQRQAYAVVVTDLRMPGMDGYTVIERLQGLQPDAAFVIVTGVPEIDVKRMKDLGGAVSEVIPKPWDEIRMVTALTRALALRTTGAASPPTAKILLLEDDPGDALLIGRQLSNWDGGEPCAVQVVSMVSEAIETLHDESIEVVLADLSLPDAVGLDVVRRLGTAAPATAIVVLAGTEDDDLGLRAIQLGAQDYLVKGSVDGPTLRRAVRHALERKRASQFLTNLAHRDPLTGLANRLTFRDRLAHAMAVARRTSSKVAVIYVDLDRFKPVNDTYGHETGDRLLQEVASRLQAAVRGSDTVARLGGDEFAVIVENVHDEGQLAQVLDRIRAGISRPFVIDACAIETSASLGVATFPGAGATGDDLIRAADRAMYRAKRNGGERYEVAEPSEPDREVLRLRFHQDLHKGLANEEFVLHFQPQYDLRTGDAVGLEALLRWRRGGGELLPPADFVPALEDTGLIVEVGRWVLAAACARARQLHDSGSRIRVAVNVSPVQFAAGNLIDSVLAALSDSGLAPSFLELEMTERTMMRDTRPVNDTLAALKEAGIRLTIDDFGTGYASLGYLSRFRVDALKIDKSFIHSLATCPGASIADAIVDVGHRLGLEVVAEGVENDAQLALLRERGCDFAQGFLLGRPLPEWSPAMLAQAQPA
jgi:diguanylate cyclase